MSQLAWMVACIGVCIGDLGLLLAIMLAADSGSGPTALLPQIPF